MSSPDTPPHRYLGGTEMEYPIMLRYNTGGKGPESQQSYSERYMSDAEVQKLLDDYLPSAMCQGANPAEYSGRVGSYASNGARIYKDIGSKLEYATPECTSYRDTVHAKFAGEQIVVNTLKAYAASKPGMFKFVIPGRVVDCQGATWGHHESYLMPRIVFPKLPRDETQRYNAAKRHLLYHAGIAHLATRQIFTGAGALRFNATTKGYQFERSQKIPALTCEFNPYTTGNKPLFNARDEAHADEAAYYRWHVTCGDYNLSPWAAWLNTGVTDLLGYLVTVQTITGEGNLERISLKPGAGHKIAAAISRDENHAFELANGQKVRAVDVQEMISDDLEKLHEKTPEVFTTEDTEVIRELRSAIDSQRCEPESLTLRVDWRKKQEILDCYIARHPKATFTDLHKVEQFWDNLDGGKGVQLRKLTPMPGYDPQEIATFVHHAPLGSRASIRSKLIKRHTARNYLVGCSDWESVTVSETTATASIYTQYSLDDPYGVTHSTHVTSKPLSKAS